VSSRLLAIPHWLTASITDVIHRHCMASHNTQREHMDDRVDLISLYPPPNIYITQCYQTRRWPSHWHEASYQLKMSNHLPPECLLSFPFPHLLFTFSCSLWGRRFPGWIASPNGPGKTFRACCGPCHQTCLATQEAKSKQLRTPWRCIFLFSLWTCNRFP
jgi:hypothetical protein